ncbi:type II toxin-antitoxin system PemK/MazF family toxin [Flavimobilis sp. GY10621]|uniref:Type II toxin-antitoxin system PemK/MazF family toxin n=1 Tax=Flavimobilis rhizosphaerae TaxID=2775421 RepID=A0ABR9DSK7_9MICO|nr:type II toxin-antitoxin system PemK/MazF family toxin [Flavimobilis rhizosphaerae]MBD9700117.1 type II toxin-antitoxin system PemK/MazF family toxin [Flavimobilis rhizosphaerae]
MPRSTWSDTLARAARIALSFISSTRTTTSTREAAEQQPSAGQPSAGPRPGRPTTPARPDRPARPSAPAGPVAPGGSGYPGDFRGRVEPVYNPELDGDADPGEIVWTWVPYEEDHSQGKDRPVLVVGHDGDWLLGLMLSSKDHTRGRRDDGPRWMDIGSGPWDARGRESEVRLDRVLRLDPVAVRREGAIMDRPTFDKVVGSL